MHVYIHIYITSIHSYIHACIPRYIHSHSPFLSPRRGNRPGAEASDDKDPAKKDTNNAPTTAAPAPPKHILIDACAIRVLDLTALGALADIVEEAEDRHIEVIVTNASHRLKALFTACGLWDSIGGDLCTQSTEEVYAMLLEEMTAVETMVVTDAPLGDLEEGKVEDEEGGKGTESPLGNEKKNVVAPPQTFQRMLSKNLASASVKQL